MKNSVVLVSLLCVMFASVILLASLSCSRTTEPTAPAGVPGFSKRAVPGEPDSLRFYKTGDVLCVPPYGSLDVEGSGGEVIVHIPGGEVAVVIESTVEGLLPDRSYTVYLMNYGIRGAGRWEDEQGCDYGPWTAFETFMTDEHGNGTVETTILSGELVPGTYQLSVWINDTAIDGTVLVSDSFEFVHSGTGSLRFYKTGDVLCVPPYGSLDVEGSGGEVVVDIPGGEVAVVIESTVEGLLPERSYTVYLMNYGMPGAGRWEDERWCNYGPWTAFETFMTDEHGNGSVETRILSGELAPGTYQLSVWINDTAIDGTVLVSDSFEFIHSGTGSLRFYRSGDVLCVPPYGSFDVEGSGGEVVVDVQGGEVAVVIESAVEGLLPERSYTVYLMNYGMPGAVGWEDERWCNYGPWTAFETFMTDEHGNGTVETTILSDELVPGTYQLSVWINDTVIDGTVLVSDSFEVTID